MNKRTLKTWRVRFYTNRFDRWPNLHEMHVEAYDRAHALMLAAMATSNEPWAQHVTRSTASRVHRTKGGLRETTEASMVQAHQAGMAYWNRNKPEHATRENLASLARSCGWHGEDETAWLAGFYGAKRRAEQGGL